jgi:hypothetical protein
MPRGARALRLRHDLEVRAVLTHTVLTLKLRVPAVVQRCRAVARRRRVASRRSARRRVRAGSRSSPSDVPRFACTILKSLHVNFTIGRYESCRWIYPLEYGQHRM